MAKPIATAALVFLGADLLAGAAHAHVPPFLVQSIIATAFERNITQVAAAGDLAFFVGPTPASGGELWATDGTPGGTYLVRDIAAGPHSLGAVGNLGAVAMVGAADHVCLLADDRFHGTELWVSDGTLAGTSLVRDLAPGAASATISQLTGVGPDCFFVFDDGVHGAELWVSDGTREATELVADLTPGPAGSEIAELADLGGIVFFRARTPALGAELWRSDGTSGGTAPVADVWPGPGSSGPTELVVHQGRLYFRASDPEGGRELWSTDGTAAGTLRVADLLPGPTSSLPALFRSSEGLLFFSARDGAGGHDLYATDGTEAGTRRIRALAGAYPQLAAVGDAVVFASFDPASGSEPWRSDGTEGGTFLLADLAPGPGSCPGLRVGASFGPSLLFRARTCPPGAPSSSRWWITDGTPAGTTTVASFPLAGLAEAPPLYPRAPLGTGWIIGGFPGLHASDGTVAGTVAIPLPGRRGSCPAPDAGATTPSGPSGSAHVFLAGENCVAPRRTEIWRTDGTPGGTWPVVPRLLARVPGLPVPFRQGIFFAATSATLGREPWLFDASGPRIVKDIAPPATRDRTGPTGSFPVIGDTVFFSAADGIHGRELWASDGTEAGTRLVFDQDPARHGAPSRFYAAGDTLYFSLDSDAYGRELWRSDGTGAGTSRLVDLYPGPVGSAPQQLTVVGDRLFFSADHPDQGRELWVSDGTAAGTRLVTDLIPGPNGSVPLELAAIGSKLLFRGCAPGSGCEPWVSNGTPAGTHALGDIAPGEASSFPASFARYASGSTDLVLFSADDGSGGAQLWAVFSSETAVCGDGVLDPGERCDDGNRDSGDGCDSSCRPEP